MITNVYLGQFILVFIFHMVHSLECQTTFIESNELVYSNLSQHFMIENDSNDYANINVLQYPLTQQLNQVSYDQNALIINTIIIDSLFKEFILEKQFCTLYKLEGYYISCIFIEGLFQQVGEREGQTQEHQQSFNTFERFKIPIVTQIDENCEFLFQNNLLELFLFCTNINNLNIYFINQNNLTITKQNYKIEEAQIQQCKKKYLQLFENSCLLIFYECVQWAIYNYKNNLPQLILNREIAIQTDPSFNINFVENVQICQDNFILIGDNQYYHYSYKLDNRLLFNFQQEMANIKQILFNKNCIFQYFLVGSELNNKLYIQNQFINYEIESISKYIYFVSNMLFLINDNELEVILNKKFKEKIQLKTFPLHFIEMNNIFYQIDQESKVFRFFKYKILNNPILKPSKRFLLFYPYNKQFISVSPIKCISLEKKETSNNINTYSISLNCECEKIETVLIQKYNTFLPNNYKILIEQDPLNLIDIISDQQQFEQICRIPKHLLINSRLLYYNSYGRTYSIFQTSKFLNILFCDNQQLFQISIHNQNVFNYYDRFILLNDQADHFRYLQILHDVPIQIEYKLESIIQEVLQCSKYVLLITKSESLILFNLILNQQIQLPFILNNLLVGIYLANINQNDKSKNFCLNILKNFYFIQYYEHFIVFQDGQLSHFKLKQQQVIQIKQISHVQDGFQIIVVDLIENALIQYIFDLIDLTFWEKYTFKNITLIHPIAYQEVSDVIKIGVIMKNISYLHIFLVADTKPLKLIQIIQMSQNHSFMSLQKLYYFDTNNEIQMLDLLYLRIQFKPLLKKKNNLKFYETLHFYLTPEVNNSKVEFALNLSIFTYCDKLLPPINELSIILDEDNHKIIDLNDLLEGPIDILKIQDNSNVLLEGPFLSYLQQDELSTLTYKIEQFNITISLTTIQQFSNQKQILEIQVQDQLRIFQGQQGIILQGFYINKDQILFIYSLECIMQAQIFRINQDNSTLIEVSNTFIIENPNEKLEVIQIENLFQIRTNLQDILFYVQNGNILVLPNKNGVKNLIIIYNSDQLYLQIKLDTSINQLTIHTIKIYQMELEIINQYTLNFDNILDDLSKTIQNLEILKYSQIQIYPITALANNQTLNIKCLIILQNFSVLQFIQINQVSNDLNFTLLKIVRNPQNNDSTFHFIDENYLILNEGQNCFIYDFRVTKSIYNYKFLYQSNLNRIYSYNTTHYIIYQQANKNFTLGQIGYRISILDDQTQNETCTLIAQNKISIAQIVLQVNKISNTNQFMLEKMTQFGIVIFILIILILLLYFIRRSFLKQKLEQPSKEFSSLSQ